MITGGTGFFGKALLRRWLATAEAGGSTPQVVVLSRDPEGFLGANPEFGGHPWLSFSRGDILEPGTLPLISGISHFIHGAADSTLGPQLTDIQRFNQIVDGTRHVLEWAVKLGVKRVLFCSSGGVYGLPPIGVSHLDEAYNGMPDPLAPKSAYGVGKRAAEHLCGSYADQYRIEIVIARCFAFVGKDLPLNVHFAIGNFIRDALSRDAITVSGDGTAVRSYLDQRDLADWLTTILERGKSGRAYNVGSDRAIDMAELARLVRDLLSPEKEVRILGVARGGGERQVYVPNIERARSELALDVRIPLEQAIKDAAMPHRFPTLR
jgi:UDP-glucuronate decarboxylase